MVFRVKLLNLDKDRLYSWYTQQNVLDSGRSTLYHIRDPIALCCKSRSEHEINLETVPPLPSLLAVPVKPKEVLPTAVIVDHKVHAPLFKLFASETFCRPSLLNQFLRLKFMREGDR